MAKFEETLKNSTLTFNTLPEDISKKVADLDKMYKTYREAIEAKDSETSSSMKKDLVAKDNEIDSMLKNHIKSLSEEKKVSEAKVEPKAETKLEPQPEVKENPVSKTEADSEDNTDENKNDSGDDKVTIGFFEC
tara:strand:+ start:494 stop:895 length:402 start_codon:yes stop_codon:yes gene_type:complete